jgi:hypothetical protein
MMMMMMMMMMSTSASAVFIPSTGVDVGQVDELLGTTTSLQVNGSCPKGSKPEAEMCWSNSLTGLDYVYSGKTATVQTYATDVDGVIAFELEYGPGSYIVKNSKDWALFNNLSDFNWGVINVSKLPTFNLDGEQVTISHLSEFNGGLVEVEEPKHIFLLGVLLLSLRLRRGKA